MITILKSILINSIEIEQLYRCQDYFHASSKLKILLQDIALLIQKHSLEIDAYLSDFVHALNEILSAQEKQDEILIADMLKLHLIALTRSVLEDYAASVEQPDVSSDEYLETNLGALLLRGKLSAEDKKRIIDACEQVKKNGSRHYSLEWTSVAALTMKCTFDTKEFYFHSNDNPMTEGIAWAKQYAREGEYVYTIAGFGLGYHVRALLNLDERYCVIVRVSDMEAFAIAMLHMDLADAFNHPRFQLELVTERQIGEKVKGTLLFHYPSLKALREEDVKDVYMNYFMNVNTAYTEKNIMDAQCFYNLRLMDEITGPLTIGFRGKKVVFIAGGPSAEIYLDRIRTLKENGSVITCASTVFRKLVENKVVPDYVFMIDTHQDMIKHIEGVPSDDVTLLYLPTANHNAVSQFAGKRKMFLQEGYDTSEALSKENGIKTVKSGGSVSTAAFDLILQSGCEELITIGLDLAYTNQKAHAYDSSESAAKEGLTVRSVTGQMIPTIRNLNVYRLWIENRIRNRSDKEKRVRLINLSQGAYIDGMENVMI